jgi:predicted nucleic-acid-binding protein
MIAVDTNVLVRVLTNDDPPQAARAIKLLRSSPVWVARTVLLETEWVLRHAYGLDVAAIVRAFRLLAGVPRIELEDRDVVLRAIAWHADGMDFADALHLAGSVGARAFATFDRGLAKAAKEVDASPPVIAP